MAETDVDFGTTELVRIIETATVFCCCDLTSFLSEEEDGNGEDVPDRLFPFPYDGDAVDLEYSGSTRQAVGVSKLILCLDNK